MADDESAGDGAAGGGDDGIVYDGGDGEGGGGGDEGFQRWGGGGGGEGGEGGDAGGAYSDADVGAYEDAPAADDGGFDEDALPDFADEKNRALNKKIRVRRRGRCVAGWV